MKRVLLFAALIAWSGMAGAIVYKWLDAQGKVQYGDRPPNGVHAEVVQGLTTHAGSSRAARPPEPEPAPAARSGQSPGPPLKTDDAAAKKSVDNDVSQVREKQCVEARERYRKLIEGRRLFKTGDNGERQYLTSEEIDSQRLDAKRDIDATCDSPT